MGAVRGARIVIWILVGLLLTPAFAQFTVRSELEVASSVALASRGPIDQTVVGLSLRAHVEASWDLGPVELRVTLDPVARVDGASPSAPRFAPGISEALLAVPLDAAELRLGLMQQPVQTARLSTPYRLEATHEVGIIQALAGAGATVYLEAWRLRPVALHRLQDGAWGGGVSVRRDFGGLDLEAHLYGLDRLAAGIAGSGLAGDAVLYGEAWLLSGPWSARGAIGASGFAGAALWTIEAAYAPLDSGALVAAPQLLGQLDVPLDPSTGIAVDARLAWVDAATTATGSASLRPRARVRLYRAEPTSTAMLALNVDHSELGTAYALRVSLAAYR